MKFSLLWTPGYWNISIIPGFAPGLHDEYKFPICMQNLIIDRRILFYFYVHIIRTYTSGKGGFYAKKGVENIE